MRILIQIVLLLLITPRLSFGASFFDLLKSFGIRQSYDIPTVSKPSLDEYDFIVVGSGSGGSTVTNRLSENGKWKVLLLEAGQPEGIFNQVPGLMANMLQTSYNWGYRLEPQTKACLGMTDRRCTWPRGKSLGGTSTLNGMLHSRGNKLDYDLWASLGNKGWSYEEVLPYFRKSERFRIPGMYNATYHGRDGYLCVEHIPYRSPLAPEFLRAGQILGYDIVDYNGAQQIGFSYLQMNMDKGARCSASRAYLRLRRPNLEIMPYARVTKILINSQKRAYGVEYIKDGVRKRVRASKEVILSAGTIDSAKLLMLSGIGPKEHLENLGIKVIKDSKVGYNLQEHIGFFGLVFRVNQSVTLSLDRLLSPVTLAEYGLRRSGLLSVPVGIEAISFLQTKYAPDDRPDLEILFFMGALHSDKGMGFKPGYGISDSVYNAVFKPIENQHAWSVWPIVQHPKSRGRITLRSKNPFDDPILEGNFFDDPHDIEVILEGIKMAIVIASTEPFKKYNTRVHDIKIPGCKSFQFGSDDYWRCAIRHLPAMENHEVGTVKMGPANDPDAVVDPQLRVYGVQGLRVVDASIMPNIPVGHINAGIYMIGEKASDMIKQEWMNN